MQTLQQLVWYVNNVKMTGTQRGIINKAIIGGIVSGNFDTNDLFLGSQEMATNVSVQQFFVQFILSIQQDASLPATKVYEAYTEWCEKRKLEAVGLSKFGMTARVLGITVKKQKDANYYSFHKRDEQ